MITTIEQLVIVLFVVPIVLFSVYLIGRLIGLAVARSWYEIKEMYNGKEGNCAEEE